MAVSRSQDWDPSRVLLSEDLDRSQQEVQLLSKVYWRARVMLSDVSVQQESR